MKNGFIKVAALAPDLKVADVAYNSQRIIEAVQKAAADGVKVLCLPELCLTGATCGDLFRQKSLIDGAKDALMQIVAATADLSVFFTVGLPLLHGGNLYNTVAAVCGGQILGFAVKCHLTDSQRQFAPWTGEADWLYSMEGDPSIDSHLLADCREMPGLVIAICVGEDAYAVDSHLSDWIGQGATVILNPSATPEIVGRAAARRDRAKLLSSQFACGYLLAEAGRGESTTDFVYGGQTLVAECGSLLAEAKPFGDGYALSEIDLETIAADRYASGCFAAFSPEYRDSDFSLSVEQTALTRKIARRPFVPDDPAIRLSRAEEIVQIQAEGLARRVKQIGCKCVIGISGGLDSTLALLITARAFDLIGRDRRDIICVTMPGFGTTSRTKSNAELLCDSLGVTFRTIPIGDAVKQHFADIGHDGSPDVTYENSQARERTQILMDVANMVGGIVVGTGDLSELALGWATYNGDHMSMYGVNGAIPKTLVRHLVAYFAEISADAAQAKVLLDILDTPVSPELLPAKDGEIAQKTEDLVGPYDLHDFFLYYFLRYGFSPEKIYRLAKSAWGDVYDDATVLKWLRTFLRRFFAQQFKRSCLPDGPAVGTVGLSPRGGWQMPSDASAVLWLAEMDALEARSHDRNK